MRDVRGRVVEEAPKRSLFSNPQHPYTWGLLGSIPRLDRPRQRRLVAIPGAPPSPLQPVEGCRFEPRCPHRFDRCTTHPELVERVGPGHRDACHLDPAVRPALRQRSLQAETLGKPRERSGSAGPAHRGARSRQALPRPLGLAASGELRARSRRGRGSLAVDPGETLGIVGESGCGKSTLGRLLVRLDDAHEREGDLRRRGHHGALAQRAATVPARDADGLPGPVRVAESPEAGRADRRRSAADPRPRLGRAEMRRARRGSCSRSSASPPAHVNRYPHEFSGGQRQRIGVARALALNPQLIVADEPVSALDVSIQAQVVNLLDDLQDEFGLTYVFIAHDLGVVRHVSDRIAVMYLGVIVELGRPRTSSTSARSTRTRRRCSPRSRSSTPARTSAPRERIVLEGEVPSPIAPPTGCRFHPRCSYATEICRVERPPLLDYGNGRVAACHHPLRASRARRDAKGVERGGTLHLERSRDVVSRGG